ncbi:MAG TPA: hypothetical protein VF832_00375 [Longimicrobiales bacterium]
MRLAVAVAAALLLASRALAAQEVVGPKTIAPGFSVRPDGVLDIGPVSAEVYHYDPTWRPSEQHEHFRRDPVPLNEATRRGARTEVIRGQLATPGGTARLVEQLEPADGGIRYAVTVAGSKPIPTNALVTTLLLPRAAFAGKTVRVDGRAVQLPAGPRPRGQARLLTKPAAREVVIPLPRGTLIVSGSFSFLVQDDREWGEDRYAVWLGFSPDTGQIRTSRIDVRLTLDRARRQAAATTGR